MARKDGPADGLCRRMDEEIERHERRKKLRRPIRSLREWRRARKLKRYVDYGGK